MSNIFKLNLKINGFFYLYFIFVNCLFLYKYTERIAGINELIITVFYAIILLLLPYLFRLASSFFKLAPKQLNYLFWTGLSLTLVLMLYSL